MGMKNPFIPVYKDVTFKRVFLYKEDDDRYMDIFDVYYVNDKDRTPFQINLYSNGRKKVACYINAIVNGKLLNVASLSDENICITSESDRFSVIKNNRDQFINDIKYFIFEIYTKKERDSIYMHKKMNISKDTADTFGELMSEL